MCCYLSAGYLLWASELSFATFGLNPVLGVELNLWALLVYLSWKPSAALLLKCLKCFDILFGSLYFFRAPKEHSELWCARLVKIGCARALGPIKRLCSRTRSWFWNFSNALVILEFFALPLPLALVSGLESAEFSTITVLPRLVRVRTIKLMSFSGFVLTERAYYSRGRAI